MTPAFLSQRGRQFNMLFILTTALYLVYICPVQSYFIQHLQLMSSFGINIQSIKIIKLINDLQWIFQSSNKMLLNCCITLQQLFIPEVVLEIQFSNLWSSKCRTKVHNLQGQGLKKKRPNVKFREQSFFKSYNKFLEIQELNPQLRFSQFTQNEQ
ncbi:unnamed protein product (macronuclear) [Paramecium tetraurelia]|uniref:Transmembrane protein n=1 Tax=Paramecium tetraurelia TaxID=5888 RepID=A0BZT2_PARTE|nr:uncharacterized protein GSPATT00005901001 [Paramecium tetraurelia]CAK64049.1 unnamed protein product [Paramecium tetraurelia]|eukprot:XP_001431447.1 hypothetical protein (macronuclear) [Paramecium tetraurelia strain d4-2]